MASLMKIALILFMMSFMIGILTSVYDNEEQGATISATLVTKLGEKENTTIDFVDDYTTEGQQGDQQQYELSALDSVASGKGILTMLKEGLNPFSALGEANNYTPPEKMFAVMLTIIRVITSFIILPIALYQFFVNRSTD